MKNNLVFGIIIGVVLSFGLDIVANTIISSQSVSYSNNKTAETTVNGALNELFSAIDINNRLGDTTKISTIGDGTVSGSISTINNNLQDLELLGQIKVDSADTIKFDVNKYKSLYIKLTVAADSSIVKVPLSIATPYYSMNLREFNHVNNTNLEINVTLYGITSGEISVYCYNGDPLWNSLATITVYGSQTV